MNPKRPFYWHLSIAALPNGFVASGFYQEIKIWNSDNDGLVKSLIGQSSFVFSLTVTKDGYLASGSFDNSIKIWGNSKKNLFYLVFQTLLFFSKKFKFLLICRIF